MESALVECCWCLIEEQGKYLKVATIYLRKANCWTEKNCFWKWSRTNIATTNLWNCWQKFLKFYKVFIIQGEERVAVICVYCWWLLEKDKEKRKCGLSNDPFLGVSQASLNIGRIFCGPTCWLSSAAGMAIRLQSWRCTEVAFIGCCSLFLFGKMKMFPVCQSHWFLWQWKWTVAGVEWYQQLFGMEMSSVKWMGMQIVSTSHQQ